ncbi:hypothetical protein PGT21_015652 [Puccinia graminis f. sp. tritici]|uniref:DDE Tnp4 domain-containing protein n=1 Tax=Puccinia graminis f. sp. tritici TaxID=56615 RepID=A0A5B0MLN1_PUCGR|nr:hypothetical protein PGT21_015652 [Puccinia graminis f. sp. tritici]
MGNSRLALEPDQFFSPGEYLLADSAFVTTPTIVAAFKRPPHGKLTDEQVSFNYYLARHRVLVEHCIGALKARFQSLKGLRLRIDGRNDQIRVNAWIQVNNPFVTGYLYVYMFNLEVFGQACAVLHNFLNQGDEFEFDDAGTENDHDEERFNREKNPQRSTLAGRMQRDKIMSQVLEFHG